MIAQVGTALKEIIFRENMGITADEFFAGSLARHKPKTW